MSALDEHLKKHRQKIIDREEKTFRDLAAAYREIEKQLKESYDELQKQIEDALAAEEETSPSWFFRQNRLKKLLAQVNEQIARFGGKAAKIIEREQRAAILIAVEQANETVNLELKLAGKDASFAAQLNPRAVETAVGAMGDRSPLRSYFEQQLAPLVADKIKSEVVKAAALGTGFKTISKRLSETGAITKHRALSVARTEVNRVRRETARQIYEENDDIFEAWEWVASKSSRTCPLCLAMDGRQFRLDEPFPQHVNCRCTMKAVIKGLPARPRTLGKDWFEKQTDATKETILGKETFVAYKQHNLNLDDFVAFRNDKRFGKSVTRKPLAKILADKGIAETPAEEIRLPQNVKVTFERGTKTALQNLLGKKLSKNEIGAMVGAFDEAEVSVTEHDDKLSFAIKHPLVEQQIRTLGRDDADRLYLHNDYFRAAAGAPKGVGIRSFATQALNAKAFGVEYIHTYAAGYKGHPMFNGYYTWARMGYNAPLTAADKRKLPEKYRHCDSLNELMRAGGKADWEEHGDGREMIFDLSDDSDSLKILEKYLRERNFIVKF